MNTIKKLIKNANATTFTNANLLIENSGLNLKLIEDLPFMKIWRVIDNKEIVTIMNMMKYCGENIADVGVCWK